MCLSLIVSKTSMGENTLPIASKKIRNKATSTMVSAEDSKRRLTNARLLFERGKSDAAIYMLQQLAKDDPDNYEVLLELGRIAVGAKNWAYSIQVFRKASLMRQEDIEVRLILMDVYKAYQMPIQEIIVAKEIFELDPSQRIAVTRLSELYQKQAMYEEEITFRRLAKKLDPSNYKNLKRLAEVLYTDTQLWESAKVYEQIRKYYPENLVDLRKLASIYAKLDERFHENIVYNHIEDILGEDAIGKEKAIDRIRSKTSTIDKFKGGGSYTNTSEATLNLDRYDVVSNYTHLLTRSFFNLGIKTRYSHLNYRGRDILSGKIHINSALALLKGTRIWKGGEYILATELGFHHDDVSGRLFGRNALLTENDFPFLGDPSFDSYGGTIPIGGLSLSARPWHRDITYRLEYKHSVVDELDARLSLFTQNKISASVFYQSRDMTDIHIIVDNTFVSDGNHRFHIKGAGYYTLWGSGAMYDYRGHRQKFIRSPRYYIQAGYEIDYFDDDQLAKDNKYETFINSELRHQGFLIGQGLLYSFDSDHLALFKAKLSYGAGTTLNYQKQAQAELIYSVPSKANSLSLVYTYEDSSSINTTDSNLQIAGFTDSHILALNFNWHF